MSGTDLDALRERLTERIAFEATGDIGDNRLIIDEHDCAALFVTALMALWWGEIVLLGYEFGVPAAQITVCPCGGLR